MALIFIFIDGLGIGPDHEHNPLTDQWEGLSFFSGSPLHSSEFQSRSDSHWVVTSLDARLGIDGLPQSGTGQTTLFSGENAAGLLGRHHGPYPHTKIKPLLSTPSMFGKAKQMGYRCHFLNAYPERFFEIAEKRNRWSCTTKMCIENDIRLNREEDVLKGRALTAEIFQDIWRKRLGINLPDITEHTAAERIASAAENNDLVLYEYYLTDKAGHGKDGAEAEEAISRIDRLLQAVAGTVDFERNLLLICSDHGNIEDLSTKTHTMHPVPLLAYGTGAKVFSETKSLTDVRPAIMKWLSLYEHPVRS